MRLLITKGFKTISNQCDVVTFGTFYYIYAHSGIDKQAGHTYNSRNCREAPGPFSVARQAKRNAFHTRGGARR
jgi:hypothetical protein